MLNLTLRKVSKRLNRPGKSCLISLMPLLQLCSPIQSAHGHPAELLERAKGTLSPTPRSRPTESMTGSQPRPAWVFPATGAQSTSRYSERPALANLRYSVSFWSRTSKQDGVFACFDLHGDLTPFVLAAVAAQERLEDRVLERSTPYTLKVQ